MLLLPGRAIDRAVPGSPSYLLLLAYSCEFLPLGSALCGFSDPMGSSAKQENNSGAASRSTAWEVPAKRGIDLAPPDIRLEPPAATATAILGTANTILGSDR